MTTGRYKNLLGDSRGTTANLTRGSSDTVALVTQDWVFGNGYAATALASSVATATLSTGIKLAAQPSATSTITANLSTKQPIAASCSASSTVTANLTIPLWQKIDAGIYDADLIKLSDTLFFSVAQNSVGVLSGGAITWTAQDAYPNGRTVAGVCALTATTLLGYGGYTDGSQTACVSEAYIGTISGSTLSWAAATSGPKTKVNPNLILLNDGRVLIANGGNPPTDPSFSYDALFATISGTTITYGQYLESSGSWWYGWQKSVVLADGRILAITPYQSYAPDYKPQFDLVTVSGNTFTVASTYCNIVRAGVAPTGWFAPGIARLTDGRIVIGGGYWHDGTNWQTDANIYQVEVSGDTVTLAYLLDMPYVVPPGEFHGTSLLGLSGSKAYVNGESWSLGGFTKSLQLAGAELGANASVQPSVVASLTTGVAGSVAATCSATSTITANLTVGVKLSATAITTPTVSAELTTSTGWTDVGGAGEYPAYGLLQFDTTHFYDIYQRKLGVLSGDVMTWYATNVPSATYVGGHGFCVLDATHIFCSGGTDAGYTIGTAQCWVGTLSGTTITWASAGYLPETRCNHTATKLADGRILINGGYAFGNTTQRPNSDFLTLTSYSLSGTVIANSHPEQYIAKLPVLLGDGRVLWANGQNGVGGVGFSLLTVSGNTYSKLDVFLPYSFGAYSGIYNGGLVKQSNGRILYGGGSWKDDAVYPPVREIYEIEVVGNTLTKSPSPLAYVPVVEDNNTASYLAEGPSNNTIYVSGGGTYGQYMRVIPANASIAGKLNASVSASSTVTAGLTTNVRLSTTLYGTAAASATLSTGIRLAAQLSSTSVANLISEAGVAHALNGALVTNPLITAALTVASKLAGAISANPAITANLSAQIRLGGTAAASSMITAGLRGNHALSATLSASALATASLLTKIRLAAVASASPAISATLQANARFVGPLTSASVVTATLTTKIKLNGSLSAKPVIYARLYEPWEGNSITVRRSPKVIYVVT